MENEPEDYQLNALEVSQRKMWYSKTFLLFAMLEHSKGHEVTFLSKYNRKHNVRYLNIGSVEILMKFLGLRTNTEKNEDVDAKDPYKFFSNKKNLSIYCSLAKIDWEKCPIKAFSYAVSERIKQQKQMKESLVNYMTDFTGCIDFDGDEDYTIKNGKERKISLDISQEEAVNRALSDMKKVIEIFNEYGIKWRTHFSGTRGFHLFWENPHDISVEQKLNLVNDMVSTIKSTFDLRTIDSARYNFRKVMKLSYSIVTFNNISRVVLPLSQEQIKKFKLSDVEHRNVYYNIPNLKNRGLMWNNTNFNKSKLVSNMDRFLEDFEIEIPEVGKK